MQFSPPWIISFPFGPNILLCNQFLNTFSLCYSLYVRGTASQPYKTTDKIIVSCILILKCLHRQARRQKVPYLDCEMSTQAGQKTKGSVSWLWNVYTGRPEDKRFRILILKCLHRQARRQKVPYLDFEMSTQAGQKTKGSVFSFWNVYTGRPEGKRFRMLIVKCLHRQARSQKVP
jgi:hypothetical protein